jgi:Site-specific recombinase XerD
MTGPTIPLIIKFEDWPEIDRKLWERAFVSGGLFDTSGMFVGWSEGTRRLHAQNYGSWLSFLLRSRPERLVFTPTERITKETVTAYVDESRQHLKLRSISNQLMSIAVVARGFAPDDEWGWLFHAARSLYEQSNPHQLKPPIPITAADLFEWSLALLNRLEDNLMPDPVTRAMRFRQALMVGLLIARPIRVRALMAMTVSRHIDVSDHGMTLSFTAADMKDRKARRFPMPEQLISFMLHYLDHHRPTLLRGRQSDALWISQRGNPMSIDSFTSGLAQLTNRVFGLTLRPHAFRHIAATSIATYDPEHVGIIRDILGHATLRTAEQHYNRATAVEASRKLQDVLRGLRSRKSRRNEHRRRWTDNRE